MPLKQSGSKKAFVSNVKAEMHAGKPQPQSLAIAYSVQRKNKRKKMADGGEVDNKQAQQEQHDRNSEGADKQSDMDKFQGSVRKAFDMDDAEKKAYGGKIDEHMAEEDHMMDMDDAAHERRPMPQMKAYGGDILEEMAREDHQDEMDNFHDEHEVDAYGESHQGDMHAEEDEDYDSIADAIMAERKEAANFADGGEVDIDENAEEEPNFYYHQNEDAALKENYDSDMDGMHQPEDSNEHGHDLSDEDEHDMVEKIRRHIMFKRKI